MRLRVPGPTPVPPRVLAAIGRQVVYHRGRRFKTLLHETTSLLKPIFGTSTSTPIILTASGTGGLEAALANAVMEGDKVLVLNNGHWGARFGRLAAALGAKVETVESPWGAGADTAALRHRLSAPDSHDFAAVLVAHNDTFTGAVSDLQAIGAVVRDLPALLIVDAVSSLGCMPVESDSWGLDIVVSATQKGMMCPPGLALVTVSDKAWRRVDRNRVRGEYWDLRQAQKMSEQGETSFTPAVNLVFGLHEALTMMHERGIPATYARQSNLGEALAIGTAELGFSLFPHHDVASPCVGVLLTPESVDANRVVSVMRETFRTVIAGARRSRLDGTVIRLGTMGYCHPDDIRLDVYQLAATLNKLGVAVDSTNALENTERVLQKGSPS